MKPSLEKAMGFVLPYTAVAVGISFAATSALAQEVPPSATDAPAAKEQAPSAAADTPDRGRVTPPPAGQGPSSTTSAQAPLGEIVVTGQRRSENLMRTAVAATSLTQGDLEKKDIHSVVDLQYAVPSLSVQEVGHTSSFNIRGIGQQSTDLNSVPGVPLYIDGLLNPTILSNNPYFDTATVEVFRGPQGTFAGASSTGGAIFVNSRNPDFNGLHGYFGAHAGNYQDVGFNGAVNIPMTGQLAGRVAGDVEHRNSFFVNAGAQPGPTKTAYNAPGKLDYVQMRGSLLWNPSEDISVLSKTFYSSTETGGYPYIPLPNPIYAPFISQVYPDPTRVLHLDTVEMSHETAFRSTLDIKWKIGEGVSFRSLTGYGKYRSTQVHDIDATVLDLPDLGAPHVEEDADTPETTVSQEFNLLSPQTGKFQWILGAFDFHDRIGQISHAVQTGSNDNFNNVLIKKHSWALFGQVSYQIIPSLQLQVGGRYTDDKATTAGYNQTVGSPPSPRNGSYHGHNITGKGALNYQLNDDNFLYAFIAKGANAGGTANGVPFLPTIVWDYEAGWKSFLFDRHLRMQVGVFHTNLTNFQADALTPVNGTITPTNIPTAKIDGVELQLQAKAGGFTLDFGGNYIKSKMGAFTVLNLHDTNFSGGFIPLPQCPPGSPSIPNTCIDYSSAILSLANAPLPYLPKVSFEIGLEYTHELGNGDAISGRVNYSHQGFQFAGLTELHPLDDLPAHGLLGAQLSYRHGPSELVLYGTNLTNKVYVSGQSPPAYFIGAPRQYGVRFSTKF